MFFCIISNSQYFCKAPSWLAPQAKFFVFRPLDCQAMFILQTLWSNKLPRLYQYQKVSYGTMT